MGQNLKNIPKIAHLYWDGKAKMSELQTFTLTTFHKLNPEWKIVVYVPTRNYSGSDTYIPDYTGVDQFNMVRKMGFVKIEEVDLAKYGIRSDIHDILRSDIFRYKKLRECGGIWTDFDVIWLKPLTDLMNVEYVGHPISDLKATVCMLKTVKDFNNISVLISTPKHSLYDALIEETDRRQKDTTKLEHQHFGTSMFDKMYPTFADTQKAHPDVTGLKYETIFPYSIYNMFALYYENDLNYITPNTICVHWFNGHKFSKEYVNKRYKSECSMTTILKQQKLI
jgi:hypothetical protein